MKKYIAEATGTFFLMLAVGLSGSALGTGLVLAGLVYLGGHISGAHYNPAVSFGFLLLKKIPLREFIAYVFSQLFGAKLAAFVLYYIATVPYTFAPASSVVYLTNFSVEMLLTFVFVAVVLTMNLPGIVRNNQIYGLIIGLTLAGVIIIGESITGAVFNPALAIAAVFVDFAAGGASYLHLPLYIFAPFTGGALAAIGVRYLNK